MTSRHSPWNEARDARLREAWARGDSASRIAEAMGTTKNAIVGRAHRLKLPKRDLPVMLAAVRNKPRVFSSARFRVAGAGTPPASAATHQNLAGNGSPLPRPRAAVGSALLSPFLAQTSGAGALRPRPQLFPVRGCQFPLWGDKERVALDDVRFCDAPGRRNAEGRQDSAYCAAHHAVCFTVARKLAPEEARQPKVRPFAAMRQWGGYV